MKRYALFLPLLVTAAYLGCSTGKNASDYFPLAVGMTHTYSETVPSKEKKGTTTGYATYTIIKRTKDSMGTIFEQADQVSGQKQLFLKNKDGIYVITSAGKYGETFKILKMKSSLKKGLSWEFNPGLGVTFTSCVIDDDVTLTTPAGVFEHCLKIEIRPPEKMGMLIWEWYAPGVGLVKRSNVGTDIDQTIVKYHM